VGTFACFAIVAAVSLAEVEEGSEIRFLLPFLGLRKDAPQAFIVSALAAHQRLRTM
jgi:hypothetical protein